MTNVSKRFIASDKHERVGPDYFGYYATEVVNLLSEDENILPDATQTYGSPKNKYNDVGKKLINCNDIFSSPLYSNCVELSDLQSDRLRSLLTQSAFSLSSEVDEVVDPIFSMYHLQFGLRSKNHSLNHMATTSNDVQQIQQTLTQTSNANCQVSEDVQFLLENASVEVEEMVKKHSHDLSETLGYMEQQLELLLDAVMSKCRSMTLGEKQQLQKFIQKLPARNLDRVVEIICRSRPVEEQNCNQIFVDLEKLDNATLWRVYYYVEAVEKAKSLSCSEDA